MNIQNALKSFFALSALVAFGAHAAIIDYSFTASSGHTGTFSYDDTAVTIGSGPYGLGGVAYSALSFVLDGSSIASPELVIYQNYGGDQFAFFTSAAFYPYVELSDSGTGLFSSSAASQMDNRTLASFDGLGLGNNFLQTANEYFQLTSLTPGSAITVPEPDVAVLLLAAAAGLAIVRRRRR